MFIPLNTCFYVHRCKCSLVHLAHGDNSDFDFNNSTIVCHTCVNVVYQTVGIPISL